MYIQKLACLVAGKSREVRNYLGLALIPQAGAGTVILPEQLDLAHKAGAAFIIAPNCDEAIIRQTVERGMVSIPGAMTPTEIVTARRWGTDSVKVFPATCLGVGYFKQILAPINHIPVLVTGGVTESNVADFLAAGVTGAGIGGCLVKREWIAEGAFDKITEEARKITSIVSKGEEK